MTIDSDERRPRERILHVKGGCPACKGDVKGNNEHRFYCPACNVMWDYEHLLTYQALFRTKEEPGSVVLPEKEEPFNWNLLDLEGHKRFYPLESDLIVERMRRDLEPRVERLKQDMRDIGRRIAGSE
ncbi:hypothetical protein JXB02_05055 [Candidatus Woesearchaeota archaeon]|nr:hypothetical protein [Candidatus Woesearchaeota archaeon]